MTIYTYMYVYEHICIHSIYIHSLRWQKLSLPCASLPSELSSELSLTSLFLPTISSRKSRLFLWFYLKILLAPIHYPIPKPLSFFAFTNAAPSLQSQSLSWPPRATTDSAASGRRVSAPRAEGQRPSPVAGRSRSEGLGEIRSSPLSAHGGSMGPWLVAA